VRAVEREAAVGPELGPGPRPVITESLDALGIEILTSVSLQGLTGSTARLSDGTDINSHTVIWNAGMLASPLTQLIDADRDPLGRLSADEFLRVRGMDGVFAAGGFDREVTMTGSLCKDLKVTINSKWIYPPAGDSDAILTIAGHDWPEWSPSEPGAVEFACA